MHWRGALLMVCVFAAPVVEAPEPVFAPEPEAGAMHCCPAWNQCHFAAVIFYKALACSLVSGVGSLISAAQRLAVAAHRVVH